MSRILRVPQRCQSAHGVFTADAAVGNADFPPPRDALLRRFGAADHDLERLAGRPYVRMFLTEEPPDRGLTAAMGARRDALALAAAHDGVVVDLTVPRIVSGPVSPAASQWVGVDVDSDGLTTRGLASFGLPELRLGGVDAEHRAGAIAVLLGLSQRLLTEWPGNDPVGPASVTLHDIALAYDDQVDATGPERHTDLLIALRDAELVITLLGNPVLDLFAAG